MSDSTSGFDLDTEVDDGSNEEFDVAEFEGTPSVEADDASEVNADGTEKPKRARRKEDEEKVDPSEFAFDATPRPRLPGTGEKKAPAQKRDFQPIPAGWTTPTGLRNLLFDTRVVNTTSQAMYGFVKNGSKFPYKQHTDGRYIVPIEDETAKEATDLVNGPSEIGGKTWVVEAFKRRAERDAKREADAAKAAERAAAEADANPPEVEAPVEMVGGIEA